MRKLLNNRVFEITFLTIKILFMIFITSIFCFTILMKISLHTNILGYRFFIMNDKSMTSVYEKNEVLLVKNKSKLSLGDDVVYFGDSNGLENKLIIHRIVKMDDKNITTLGIKSVLDDPPISKDKILGKVINKIPIVSDINKIIRTQLGFFLLVFLPLSLIIILEILKTITEIKNDKRHVNPKVRGFYFKKKTKNRYIIPSDDTWYITYGGYNKKTSHSYDVYGQRWAYDFDMNIDGEYFSGDGDINENYYGYGRVVLAPIDGFVVDIVDGIKDSRAYSDMRVSQDSKDVRGNYIVIKANHGEYCTICHIKSGSFTVKVGDIVSQGEKIALVGNSGRTKGAHIHLQVNKGLDFNKSEPLVIVFDNILVNGKKKHYIKVGDFVENIKK